jgi:hypothetical protein
MTQYSTTTYHLLTRYNPTLLTAQITRHTQTTQPTPTLTHWVPSNRHGRIPVIGLDTGAIPGTSPHHTRS